MKVSFPVVHNVSGPRDGAGVFFELLWRYLASCEDVEIERFFFSSIRDSGVFSPFARFKISGNVKDADIIHTHDDVGFMAKRGSIPLILSNQLYPFDPIYQRYTNYRQKSYQHIFLKRYQKKSYAVADAVVAPSDFTAASIQNDYPHIKPHVIHNGIDAETFRPMEVEDPSSGRVKLLFVGNWTRRKGSDLLPKIMERLGDDFVLIHAGLRSGTGPTSVNNIKGQGSLPSSSGQLAMLYNCCDVFLFPSRLEGLPFAVIEAMACEKPVVATNYSSLPELIVDGQGGYLCEMDNIEEFADRVRRLSSDPALRKRMGRFNRQRVLDRFTYQQMGEGYVRFYRSLL